MYYISITVSLFLFDCVNKCKTIDVEKNGIADELVSEDI